MSRTITTIGMVSLLISIGILFSVSHCQSTEDTAEYAKLILSQLATISMRLILLARASLLVA